MNHHLAEKLAEKIINKLSQSTTGKTTMRASSIFKELGFSTRKNSELIKYFETLVHQQLIAINGSLSSISKNGDSVITFFNRTENENAGKMVVAKSIDKGLKPEEHQQIAIKELDKFATKDHFATLLVLPTGGGKTFTASYWVAKNILDHGGKVLWIAHRHSLIDQAIEGFKKVSHKGIYKNKDSVKFRLISGLHDKSIKIHKDDQLVIAGIQSVTRSIKTIEEWIGKDAVTLVIDEAHHSIANSYLKLIDTIKKKNGNKIRLLGLTATPTRINEKEEAKLMALYSNGKAHEVTLDQLINKGFLAKPNFIPVKTNINLIQELELDDAQIQNIIEKDDIAKALGEKIVKRIAENSNRNDFIVHHYIQNKEKYGKTLVFAIDVNNAIALSTLFNKKGVKAGYVISNGVDFQGNNNSAQANQQVINQFASGELDVLVNVQIMTEGTDIPSIQTVFLTRPTNSTTLMTQMIGRGLRGKKAGGTAEAHIVSFIDDWENKIYWGNAEEILITANLDLNTKTPEYKKRVTQLVSLNLLEQFILSQSQEFEDFFDHTEFSYFLPLGFYHFDVEYLGDTEESISKNVSILVYDSMQHCYKRLIEDLDKITKKPSLLNPSEEAQDIISQYFANIPQLPTVKKENIIDLLNYYRATKQRPQFITFEDRDQYDLDVIAEPISKIDSRKERTIKIKELWTNSEYLQNFYREESVFIKVLNQVLLRLDDPLTYSFNQKVEIIPEIVALGDKSLEDIKGLNYNYYAYLREETIKKALINQDDEMYIECPSCHFKSKVKGKFQIDHIVPSNKGGKTELDNLQVLCISCNRKKSDH